MWVWTIVFKAKSHYVAYNHSVVNVAMKENRHVDALLNLYCASCNTIVWLFHVYALHPYIHPYMLHTSVCYVRLDI